MIRGVRGAITIDENTEEDIVFHTKWLLEEMIAKNNLQPEQVAHIWFTTTPDVNAAFPAKATRFIEGWQFVPVMCAQEIAVPNALSKCIRIMLSAEMDVPQDEVKHIYLKDATKLRPDLLK